MENQRKTLTQTFVPKTLFKKTQLKNTNPLLEKNNFQKTHGNPYVELDPPQIKFNGYQLNKINQLSFKIINKAPNPQRFNIIAPTQPHFSIKMNKKGAIPSGMYQTVYVSFKATQFKYLYDVVKINTQSQNFVVPLYAYPTIPNLHTIFPKLIDFGNIQLKQTESYLYPIKNPTSIDYPFEFIYKKQCSQIMINPLNGVIPGDGEVVIEVAFIPSKKMTYSAQVYFKLKQFDFQPIFIKVIGTGKQNQMGKTFKRLKSSKLAPLKDKDQQKQVDRMNQTQTYLNSKIKQTKKQALKASIRKTSARGSYPKLLNSTLKAKSTIGPNQTILQFQKSSPGTIKNNEQRQFMSRFNRVQQLDKQKQIKFSQFLGDHAMSEEQLQNQKQIVREMGLFRSGLLKSQVEERNNPEKSQYPQVQFNKFSKTARQLSWDDNRNDSLYQRRVILNKFVNAASKIIEVRRMNKRLEKIRQFLSDCSTKQEVAKKVEQSYQHSLASQGQFVFKGQIDLQFNRNSIIPNFFQLQFQSGTQKFSSRQFKTHGQTQFDDFTSLPLIQPKQNQKLNYGFIDFPSDFVPLSKAIPPLRVSGEQQFSVKSSSLPNVEPIGLFDIIGKPFDIPNHYFIYQGENVVKFQNYEPIDQKDPLFTITMQQPIQDQFQGWSKGDFQVLKSKLLNNAGTSYTTFSSYNYSSSRNDIGFYGDITKNIPQFLDKPQYDDQLDGDDSDDQKYQQSPVQTVQQFLQKVQTVADIKQRRTKPILDENRIILQKIEKNLQKNKINQTNFYVGKIKDLNKWIEKDQNKLVL